MKWFDLLRISLLIGGWLGAFTFVVYYQRTGPGWYRDPLGRFLMASGFGWLSIYSAGIINFFITSEKVRESLRSVLMILAFCFVWYSVSVYHRSRRKALASRKEEERGS
jgi:hypothetical protein